MVELISRISKGTRMDQIYLPKERVPGFEAGTAVLIKPVLQKPEPKPYYYNIKHIEPIKTAVIQQIFDYLEYADNVIVAGSFLEEGFEFGDIDIIVVTDKKVDAKSIEKHFKEELGADTHVISINFKTLLKGISTDPLFGMLVSKFVARRRVIFNVSREFKYKLLDLQLFPSKSLFDNFDFVGGKIKYKLTRNMIAILLFLEGRKLGIEAVNSEIDKYFGKGSVELIKENVVGREFLAKYKRVYNNLFDRIMAGVRNDSK